MNFYHAQLETPRFVFDGYGETPEHAAGALIESLRLHGKGYKLPASWYFQFLPDAVVREIRTNEPYRDGERINTVSPWSGASCGTGRILRSGRVVWD